jgi:NADH:ubiquinone oxidoreductase subunit F (NADH-binding)
MANRESQSNPDSEPRCDRGGPSPFPGTGGLLEWGRRRTGAHEPARPLDELRDGDESAAITRTGLNAAWIEGVRSFYDLLGAGSKAHEPMRCVGTACAFAGSAGTGRHVSCLGRCYEAPARSDVRAKPIPFRALVAQPIVLRHLLSDSSQFDDYAVGDGDAILRAVLASGLRGRGGAAFPTGAKWQIARETPAPERYVVANGDEGDPGAYVDRLLLEETPHAVLAGMAACAKAIGAGRGVVYVRGEYEAAVRRVRAAIEEAKARGELRGFHVEVCVGAGSYVAGEETALLRSIEGLRAEPAPKPPYPAVRGLHGLPTVVQNVETLSLVPWVVRQGKAAEHKAICLSGAIARPGVIEIALGTPLRRVIDEGGGGAPPGRKIELALVGGPMGRVVPACEFDVPLGYDTLPGLGHGGIVLLDDTVSPRELAQHLFRFAAAESCGACAPCRLGTAHLANRTTRAALERLLDTIEAGSLCGFGQGVPRPIRDLLRVYGDEVLA